RKRPMGEQAVPQWNYPWMEISDPDDDPTFEDVVKLEEGGRYAHEEEDHMIAEHVHFEAGDDPPVAEAKFTLQYPVNENGFDYVKLTYIADESVEEVMLLTIYEFKRLCKMFLRFDEKLSVSAGEA